MRFALDECKRILCHEVKKIKSVTTRTFSVRPKKIRELKRTFIEAKAWSRHYINNSSNHIWMKPTVSRLQRHDSCCTHLLGKGMVGGGLGTVGVGIGRGPLPGTWTPALVALWPSRELLPSGSAGRGFWGGLGFSKSWKGRERYSPSRQQWSL